MALRSRWRQRRTEPSNLCRIRRGGLEHQGEQRFLTLAELVRLADGVPERYRAMALLAGLGGLRQGELMALRRGDLDLDLDLGLVHVRRKRQRLASGAVTEHAPKSAAGRWTVVLPEPLVEVLCWHLSRFVQSGPNAYVFTSEAGIPIGRSNFRNRVWLLSCKACGLGDLRFHDLRHTAGTLVEGGADIRYVSEMLGHAKLESTALYTRVSIAKLRAVPAAIHPAGNDAGGAEIRVLQAIPGPQPAAEAAARPTRADGRLGEPPPGTIWA
jgi:integrase